MTVVPNGTRVPFVRPEGVAQRVRDAITDNTLGVRDAILDVVGNTRTITQHEDGTGPKVTNRRAWLEYRWLARYQPLVIPTAADGAVDGDEVAGFASTFVGATIVLQPPRAAVFTETFTGAVTGDPWPTARWILGRVGSPGGAAVVDGGQGRLVSGRTGGYNGTADMTGVAAKTAALRDVELEFTFTLGSTTESEVRVNLRTAEVDMNMATGIAIGFNRAGVDVSVANAWTYKKVGAAAKAHTPSTPYRARVVAATQADGSTLIRAKSWPATAAEPAVWDVSTTTVEPGSAQLGMWGFLTPGIGDPASNVVMIDNVAAYDRPAADDPGRWGTWAG